MGIYVANQQQIETITERLKNVLPVEYKFLKNSETIEHSFYIKRAKKKKFDLFKGKEKVAFESDEESLLDRLDSQIRITVAEFAVGYVFVHSGVVAWKNKAIIIPASSFKGKTTLVFELVKRGAVYYSDEYAVLDQDGMVHPFAKTLSIREKNGGSEQTELSVEAFGGRRGEVAIDVGMVLVTEFRRRARWRPEILTRGQGVLEIISHTVPIRNDPELSLNVLNKVVNGAVCVKSDRSEANRFARKLLDYFDDNVLE